MALKQLVSPHGFSRWRIAAATTAAAIATISTTPTASPFNSNTTPATANTAAPATPLVSSDGRSVVTGSVGG